MPSSRTSRHAVLSLGLLLTSACDGERADLVVALGSSAHVSPQYFHGNCFAGWSIAVDLVVRETNEVQVVLSAFDYRLVDQGAGAEVGADSLDSSAIEARFGSMANVLPGRTSRTFTVGAVDESRPSGPLEVTGSLSGRDENGNAVRASFALESSLSVEDVPPPSDGACTPS
jgi:hypothetical protein